MTNAELAKKLRDIFEGSVMQASWYEQIEWTRQQLRLLIAELEKDSGDNRGVWHGLEAEGKEE